MAAGLSLQTMSGLCPRVRCTGMSLPAHDLSGPPHNPPNILCDLTVLQTQVFMPCILAIRRCKDIQLGALSLQGGRDIHVAVETSYIVHEIPTVKSVLPRLSTDHEKHLWFKPYTYARLVFLTNEHHCTGMYTSNPRHCGANILPRLSTDHEKHLWFKPYTFARLVFLTNEHYCTGMSTSNP